MLAVPLLFLVIAPWAERAYSLECYICNVTEYRGCNTTANCSGTNDFCIKLTATTISGFRIMQSCAAVCPIAKQQWPSLYDFTCCQVDRCNGASRVGVCRTLFTMAACIALIRALAKVGL